MSSRVILRLRWSSTISGAAEQKEKYVPIDEYAAMEAQQLAGVEVALGARCPCCGEWRGLDPAQQQLVLVAGARGHEVQWPAQGARR